MAAMYSSFRFAIVACRCLASWRFRWGSWPWPRETSSRWASRRARSGVQAPKSPMM